MDTNSGSQLRYHSEAEVLAFMESVRQKYFSELSVSFEVLFDEFFEGVMGRALSGKYPKVVLHYSDDRIIQPRYRMGLVPMIAHELAHYIDPVDPERVMRERLPTAIMHLWDELLKSGLAQCSMASTERSNS